MDIEIEAENIFLKNKVVSKLDIFVIDFINILKKYMDYVVVSGYVSMLFGMLEDGLAIRVAEKDNVIPNIELKFVKSQLDRISLKEHKVAQLDTYCINISPLELQIAFKLYLGSDKDIEDAAYLYEIFRAHLSKFKIKHFMDILGVKRGDYGSEI